MNRGFIYQIIINKKITLFITAMIFIGGIYSYLTSIKQESPDFDVPVAIISLNYIGASAEEVENNVMRPLETDLSQIEGIENFTTYSHNNSGTLFIEFDYDVDKRQAFDEVRRRLDDMLLILPKEVEVMNILAGELTVTDFIYILTGKGEAVDLNVLKDEAEFIRQSIGDFEMVSSAHIQGEQQSKLYVELDASVFSNLPLTRTDLIQLVGTLDSHLPGGKINDELGTYVQSKTGLSSVDDLEAFIVAVNPMTGTPLTLSSIADTRLVEEDTFYTNYDGEQGILIYGYFKDNLDITTFADSFRDDIGNIQIGEGFELHEIIYYPDDVKASNNDFFINLLIGMLLVVIISFFSMGFRNAVVVSLALPTSIMITLIVMRLMGIKLHQVSVASMIIAIGMLVDNAIVITESIKCKVEEGIEPIKGTILGTKEVMLPVLTSTLTTVFAFSPLLFIPSIAGDYIKSVPQVIIIALSASYLVSITLMPCLAYLFYNTKGIKLKEGLMVKITSRIVRPLLRHGVLVVVGILALAMFSATLIPKIGLSFFPAADKNILYVNVQNKTGGIDATKEMMRAVEEVIAEEVDIDHYVASVGIGLPRFWDTMRPFNASEQFGQFLLLLDLTGRYVDNEAYAVALQKRLNEVDESLVIEVKELEKSEPILAPITIQVSSNSPEGLTDAKNYTKQLLEEIEGVRFIRDDEAASVIQYDIEYDLTAVSNRGLVLPAVQLEVFYGINETEVASITTDKSNIPVYLSAGIDGKNDLSQMVVGYDQVGAPVMLLDVADIVEVETKAFINRYNGDYMVTVLADIEVGYAVTDITNQFKDALNTTLFDDVKWDYAGEQQSILDNFADIGFMAIFAGLLILIILVLQFKSFRQTAIILTTIPLAAAGGVYGLYFTGYALSFTALFGLVSLMGIVVNNAILLMDSMNQKVKEGLSTQEAAEDGIKRRTRPILLTTVTTIMGLIPLMLSGSEMFAPMAIAIGSGLMFSTLITLLIIPILYGLIFRTD